MPASSSLNLPRPFGPYELVRQLAVGGMAEVFLARARSVAGFEKVVALKMIHPRFSEDPEFARLLVEEANITAQLSHRNIVQVIDLGQIDGTHYIAMEFVDGLDLSRFLAKIRERGLKLSPRFAAYVVREICDGLEHAHRKIGADGKPLKIVHRDVSPPNILLSSAGEVKLTDFGIAKAALRASSTEAGVVKGKYAYMPPEQAKGQPLDLRADVFSAGAVLYELATGVPVYKEAPLPVMLERVSKAVYDPPEKLKPELPAAVVAVIKKALSANANDRYPSARAMADDLNAYLYTLPPNPEFEVSQMLSNVLDAGRASIPPMGGVSLFDDDEDVSTQIESVAAMRQRIAEDDGTSRPAAAAAATATQDPGGFNDEPTRAMRRKDVVPGPTPTPADDDEPEATQAFRPNTATPRVRLPTPGPDGTPAAQVPMAPAPAPVPARPAPPAPAAKPGGLPTRPPLPSSSPTGPARAATAIMGAGVAAKPVPSTSAGKPGALPTSPRSTISGQGAPLPGGSPRSVPPPAPPMSMPARKPTLVGAAVPTQRPASLPTGGPSAPPTAAAREAQPPSALPGRAAPAPNHPAPQRAPSSSSLPVATAGPPASAAPTARPHEPTPPINALAASSAPVPPAPAQGPFAAPAAPAGPPGGSLQPAQASAPGAATNQPSSPGTGNGSFGAPSNAMPMGAPPSAMQPPSPTPGFAPPGYGSPPPGMHAPPPAGPTDAREKRAVIIAAVFAAVGVLALVGVLVLGR